MRAAEPDKARTNLKVKTYSETFGFSVKFDERKKKNHDQCALQKYYSFAAVGLGKNSDL